MEFKTRINRNNWTGLLGDVVVAGNELSIEGIDEVLALEFVEERDPHAEEDGIEGPSRFDSFILIARWPCGMVLTKAHAFRSDFERESGGWESLVESVAVYAWNHV